eukprot:1158689-Pelagomonas_calceolata.AAC.20
MHRFAQIHTHNHVALHTYVLAGRASGSGSVITPDALIPQLRALAQRKDVVGVVLRVDSPGGDALASDLMWREIKKLSECIHATVEGGVLSPLPLFPPDVRRSRSSHLWQMWPPLGATTWPWWVGMLGFRCVLILVFHQLPLHCIIHPAGLDGGAVVQGLPFGVFHGIVLLQGHGVCYLGMKREDCDALRLAKAVHEETAVAGCDGQPIIMSPGKLLPRNQLRVKSAA